MNGSKYERTISPANKAQAESFFKVLVSKKYSVDDIAEILGHMGGMFLEWCKQGATIKKGQ